jgi:hypothetical protein
MKYVIAVLLSLVTGVCHAGMPVEVEATGDDSVGRQLVFKIKEGIRSSSSMNMSFDDAEARMQVHVVTLEQSSDSPGYSTVYSVVITWNNPEQPFPFYLNQYTGYCGLNRVQSCADGIVADVSEASDAVLKLLARALKR